MESHAEVLVVEDDEDEQQIVGRALRRHGMEGRFRIVRSGEEALDYLRLGRPHPPKVIFLDLKLTGIDGHEVLRRIRADDSLCNIPVVIVSSSTSDREICQCYRLGANSFVPKRHGPGPPGDYVVEAVHYWLELNRPVSVD
jgi:two-component system response regulator